MGGFIALRHAGLGGGVDAVVSISSSPAVSGNPQMMRARLLRHTVQTRRGRQLLDLYGTHVARSRARSRPLFDLVATITPHQSGRPQHARPVRPRARRLHALRPTAGAASTRGARAGQAHGGRVRRRLRRGARGRDRRPPRSPLTHQSGSSCTMRRLPRSHRTYIQAQLTSTTTRLRNPIRYTEVEPEPAQPAEGATEVDAAGDELRHRRAPGAIVAMTHPLSRRSGSGVAASRRGRVRRWRWRRRSPAASTSVAPSAG